MAAEGLGGGFVRGAPKSEVASLAENMRKLAEADREILDCVVRIAETRAMGASTTSLEEKLRGVSGGGLRTTDIHFMSSDVTLVSTDVTLVYTDVH